MREDSELLLIFLPFPPAANLGSTILVATWAGAARPLRPQGFGQPRKGSRPIPVSSLFPFLSFSCFGLQLWRRLGCRPMNSDLIPAALPSLPCPAASFRSPASSTSSVITAANLLMPHSLPAVGPPGAPFAYGGEQRLGRLRNLGGGVASPRFFPPWRAPPEPPPFPFSPCWRVLLVSSCYSRFCFCPGQYDNNSGHHRW